MSITRLQQARQMYAMGQRVAKTLDGSRPGYRGSDYGDEARGTGAYSGGDSSPAAGGTQGGKTNDDGPSTPTRTTLPGNISSNEGFTVSSNPMDIREQYRIGNPSMTIPGGPSFVNFNNPYMSQGLEKNRYNNYLGAQNLRGYVPDPINIPFAPLATKGLQFLQEFGNDKNTQFFADNVAGKYGYGYGIEDYQKYMSDRTSGKVGAYGNEEQGQNALSGNQGGGGIMDVYSNNTTDDTTDDTTTEDELLLRFLGADSTLDPAAAGVANTDELRAMILERAKNLYT